MTLLVQKFGGTSMATPQIIKKTVDLVERERANGYQVVVVVSAMSGVTDQLIAYAKDMSVAPDSREYDTVVSAGEQITAGLVALALKARGIPARSWLGWQIPIQTTADFTRGVIKEIQLDRLQASLSNGDVLIVAGFQGVSEDYSVTTLGRGGSDLSAVALAAMLGAKRCDLYKDVPGIMSADPRIVDKARWLKEISYEEMLELSSLGSKVLQARAIRMAAFYGVPLRVRPTFTHGQGTLIINQEQVMERQEIRGIACHRQQALIHLQGTLNPEPLFAAFARSHIIIDMITLSKESGLMFTVPRQDAERALSLAKVALDDSVIHGIVETNFAKISLVGLGLRGHPEIIAESFKTLTAKGIEIRILSTSELKISMLVDEVYAELATRLLHRTFGLDRNDCDDDTAYVSARSLAGGM